MWQQITDFVNGMIRYSLQHLFKPDKRIDAMQLAGAQQGVEHSTSLSCLVRASKQIVLSAYCHRSDAVLYRVVINVQLTIRSIDHQFLPSFNAVAQSLTNGTFR